MKNFTQKAYLIFIYVLLYFPILILILYSFNSTRYSLEWHGFPTQWYAELFHDRGLWIAFFHSVFLAVSAGMIATALGLFACVHIFLTTHTRRHLFNALLMLLIILPDLVFGVALLIFFNFSGVPLGFISLFIAHVTFCLPFVIFTINSRIQTLDANIYFSALDLGASRTTAITKVFLPLLWPALLSAFLLSFTLSFDDVIISYFIAGPDYSILPLTIYSLVRTGVTPELNALCTITLMISIMLVILAHQLTRRKV